MSLKTLTATSSWVPLGDWRPCFIGLHRAGSRSTHYPFLRRRVHNLRVVSSVSNRRTSKKGVRIDDCGRGTKEERVNRRSYKEGSRTLRHVSPPSTHIYSSSKIQSSRVSRRRISLKWVSWTDGKTLERVRPIQNSRVPSESAATEWHFTSSTLPSPTFRGNLVRLPSI